MSRPVRKVLSTASLILIGIPRKFHNVDLEDFNAYNKDLKKVKAFISEYAMNLSANIENNSGLLFCGSNGVGKTMLSCILAKQTYKYRYTTRRTTLLQYIDKYTRVWSARTADEKESAENDLYTYYKDVEFLVLDELGKEIDTKVSTPILEDLLRYREDKGLTTVICTNLNPDTIIERYGNSIMSLLKGNTQLVLIEQNDYRNKAFKERTE